MKKSITRSLAAVILTTTLFSCNKEIIEQPASSANTEASVKSSTWFKMDFQLITSTPTTRNIVFLAAARPVTETSSFNKEELVALGFIKFRVTGTISTNINNPYRYAAIPSVLKTENENSLFNFKVEEGNFNVKIYNADQYSEVVEANQFANYSFRYILIPKSVYEKNKIDWNNFEVVAAFLHLSY